MKSKETCPLCHSAETKKVGFFVRKRNRRKVQRFLCHNCGKSFSSQTTSPTYRQKRPDLNADILENISESVGIRRTALNLRTTKNTIQRKIKIIAKLCDDFHKEYFSKWKCQFDPEFQFDEMDTFEQSSIHKLRVPVLVEAKSYFIVNAFPYDEKSGSHYPFEKAKYNKEHEEEFKKRPFHIKHTLESGKKMNSKKDVKVYSDMKHGYEKYIKEVFGDDCVYVPCKASDEEEKGKLFPVNHAMACLRAEKAMLRKKSWYFCKEKDYLEDHLKIYIFHYNYFRKKGYTIGHKNGKTKVIEYMTPAQKLQIFDKEIEPKMVVGC